jgi:hypothetical protein
VSDGISVMRANENKMSDGGLVASYDSTMAEVRHLVRGETEQL